MTEIKLTFEDDGIDNEEQFLLDIALRRRYRDAIHDVIHKLWTNWKYEDKDLTIDNLNKEIGIILTNNGLSYENFE